MTSCTKCCASIPPDARKCPECGTLTDPDGLSDGDLAGSDELVHSMLLRTHLLKTRGELNTATEECIRALRINPDCVEAHSLLGDIYRDQGKIEDAIRWYTLALDLQPDSEIDRARLDELTEGRPRTPGRAKPELPTISAWMRDRKIVTGLIGVIVLLIGIIAWVWFSPGPYDDEEPGTIAPRRSTLAWRRRAVRQRNAPNSTPVASAPEISLFDALNGSAPLTSRGLRVVSVSIDPRDSSAVATFIGPSVNSGELVQSLVTDSVLILKEIASRNDQISRMTARALYALPTQTGATRSEIVFVGDSSKDKLSGIDPAAASYEQQLQAFTSLWWHPVLKLDTAQPPPTGQPASSNPTPASQPVAGG